jgi:thiamine pyrophosphokinase
VKILLVLSGEAPGRQLLQDEIAAAEIIIAVDGGSRVFQKFNLVPHVLIGDLDSSDKPIGPETEIIQLQEQISTDLQKALDHVFSRYQPTSIMLLGATGGRTDHLVNNLQICASVDPYCQIILKHDGDHEVGFTSEQIIRITPYSKPDLLVNKGTTLSVISVSPFAGLTSSGLKWEISEADSNSGYFSQSNLARIDHPHISLNTGCVYITVYQ